MTSEIRTVAAPPISTRRAGRRGGPKALALPASLRDRLAASVWWPIFGRGAGVLATMGALAAVGATSTRAGAGVPLDGAETQSSVAGVWLAPNPEPSGGLGRLAPVAPHASATATALAHPPVEAPTPAGTENAGDAAPARVGLTRDGKVVLNAATAEELTRLPRVGPKRAAAIVALRERLGRFRKPTDLLRVRGIGVKTLRKMLPHLVVDPPGE